MVRRQCRFAFTPHGCLGPTGSSDSPELASIGSPGPLNHHASAPGTGAGGGGVLDGGNENPRVDPDEGGAKPLLQDDLAVAFTLGEQTVAGDFGGEQVGVAQLTEVIETGFLDD